jgi:NOL1/NOP2/fmu family ribosome biogenesis protein
MIQKCSPQQKRLVLEYLEKRFGIEHHHFNKFEMYAGSKGRIFLGPKTTIYRPTPVSVGLLIARIGRSIKPSTNLLQLFGRYVKKNFVSLTKEQTLQYLRGEDLELSEFEIQKATEGYVLLVYFDFPLGCGLLKGNNIKNMLPKAKRLDVEFL